MGLKRGEGFNNRNQCGWMNDSKKFQENAQFYNNVISINKRRCFFS